MPNTGWQHQQPKIRWSEKENMAEIGSKEETTSIKTEEIGESSQLTEGMLEDNMCEGTNLDRARGCITRKQILEEEYSSNNDKIDSNYDYQDLSIAQLTIPSTTPTGKPKSDLDLPFKDTCTRC